MSKWIQTSSKEERLIIRSWAHSWTNLRALVEIKTVLSHLKSFATTKPTFQWATLQTSNLLEWWSQLRSSRRRENPSGCPADSDPFAQYEVKGRVFELARRDPAFLRKIFNDFELNHSGNLMIDEVTNLIAKLKISVNVSSCTPSSRSSVGKTRMKLSSMSLRRTSLANESPQRF